MAAFVLPNRKAFADFIVRIFKDRVRDAPIDEEDADIDLCNRQLGSTTKQLFPYQTLVRDYLLAETPYRGLLLYHGLGSGKTCSSIAVAESLLSTKKIFVLLPASLRENYLGEIRKCGDPIYMFNQHWIRRDMTPEYKEEAKRLGLSDAFVADNPFFFVNQKDAPPNYEELSRSEQKVIQSQIQDLLSSRFTFISVNGLNKNNIEDHTKPNQYDDSVVVIDEAHNFISMVVNESDIKMRLYNSIYQAKRCKVVALSGTPIINSPHEVAVLMNLLRGPIERIVIPFKSVPIWDEPKITSAIRAFSDVDTIEFNAAKKTIAVTRNPPQFDTVYGANNERIAVKYNKNATYIPVPLDWVASIQSNLESGVGGGTVDMERIVVEEFECLPSKFEEFADLFLDGLNVKNPLMFQRRIQGLVSYFKGADERMLPRRTDTETTLEEIAMSSEQLTRYLDARMDEIKQDSKRGRSSLGDDLSSFRAVSRLVCNYFVPLEIRNAQLDADGKPDKVAALQALVAKSKTYLSKKGLEIYSPKMLRMLTNIEGSADHNQFIYSNYTSLEGIGILTAILDENGFQPYKIVKEAGGWVEDPEMDANKPAYALYTGDTEAHREMYRQIFNERYGDTFPASLKESVQSKPKKKLRILLASSTGAEGITLHNVRHVHVMEPHWTPTRIEQVIGRANRICSHASLDMKDRTYRVSIYVSTISDAHRNANSGFPNIVAVRGNDTSTQRYKGESKQVFLSTDEYLYEASYEKQLVSQRIATLLKQSAVDCEVHRKLHSRETPIVSCMRFDTKIGLNDLAFKPDIRTEPTDANVLRNVQRQKRRLQHVVIRGISLLIDLDSNEVFDQIAFGDNNRLLRIGDKVNDRTIQFLAR